MSLQAVGCTACANFAALHIGARIDLTGRLHRLSSDISFTQLDALFGICMRHRRQTVCAAYHTIRHTQLCHMLHRTFYRWDAIW